MVSNKIDKETNMPNNLADAILSFDKNMTSGNPGDMNKALLEMANLILHVNRIKTLPDEVSSAIIVKLQSLLENAFPMEAAAAAEEEESAEL